MEETQIEAAHIVAQVHHGEAEGWQFALKVGQHLASCTAKVEINAEEHIQATGKQANMDMQSLIHAIAQHASTVIT